MTPAGYSGTALSKKLGIRPGMAVALIGAPRGFADTLSELPEGATVRASTRGRPGLVIWFPRGSADCAREIRRISRLAAGTPLWIAWRKKSALRASRADFPGPSEDQVRRAGLSAGLVDHKVCAIDPTWSGLLFSARKNRPRRERLLSQNPFSLRTSSYAS
ncbi:MAG: DUF3052 domain-containing protein [Spirochaetia bacterium]